MVAAAVRTIFAQPDAAGRIPQHRGHRRELPAELFGDGLKLLGHGGRRRRRRCRGPQSHWRKIWSTNPLERVNVEIKRRADVVGIFANENSVLRLAGAVLEEIHDEWAVAERCYLSAGSLAKLYETGLDDNPKEVEGAHSELVA